jgi:4-hydroxyphenylacetate 3-monooxygenase
MRRPGGLHRRRARRGCHDPSRISRFGAVAGLYDALHDPYLQRYVRGSNGIGYKERIKIMKLLWDAVGTEFGGRHELYERNYAGNHEDIRIQALTGARRSGTMDQMTALVDKCMSEHDENGWTGHTWLNSAG